MDIGRLKKSALSLDIYRREQGRSGPAKVIFGKLLSRFPPFCVPQAKILKILEGCRQKNFIFLKTLPNLFGKFPFLGVIILAFWRAKR